MQLVEWLLTWLHWRANMRAWHKRLRASPQIARCWKALNKHRVIRAGYFDASGEACSIEDLYGDEITHQPWYPSVQDDLDRGATEFIKITVWYLARSRHRSRNWYVFRFFVSAVDNRLLGIISGREFGF